MPMLATYSSIALLSHTRTIATRSYMRQHIQESADKSGFYLIVKVEPFTWNKDDVDRHSSQLSMKYGKNSYAFYFRLLLPKLFGLFLLIYYAGIYQQSMGITPVKK